MPAINQDPISRSRGVRSSARAHLARLREDRLQKRLAALPAGAMGDGARHEPEPAPRAVAPPPDTPVPANAPAETPGMTLASCHEAGSADGEALRLTAAAPDLAIEAERIEPAPDTRGETLDADAVVAISARPAPTAVVPPSPETGETATPPEPLGERRTEPHAEAEALAPAADAPDPKADPQAEPVSFSPQETPSDLAELPGAGPGLVWLLQECGVTSLSELATADAADLSRRLGLVGQLLDLDHWIEHARAKS
ncbi:MAG: hypothetical protein ACOCTP_01340 [Roseicyclus sp.]